jgi:hypothetical protein
MLRPSTVELAQDLVKRMAQVKRMRNARYLERARFIVRVADMEGSAASFKGDGDLLVLNSCRRLASEDNTNTGQSLIERADALIHEHKVVAA